MNLRELNQTRIKKLHQKIEEVLAEDSSVERIEKLISLQNGISRIIAELGILADEEAIVMERQKDDEEFAKELR